MTFAEFDAYVEADAAVNNAHQQVATPCADCTVGFAEAMRAVGCCDGEPRYGRPGRPRKPFVPVITRAAIDAMLGGQAA